ncbi:hypothetical protein G9A89_010921 [Geosiphon pyriformis]|nr:hypothetical protein G9A89_010921 [Geosiphon pyriformis]
MNLISENVIPVPRSGHTANLIDERIYFLGGLHGPYTPPENNVYLDLTVNFSRATPPFLKLDSLKNLPSLCYSTTCSIKTSNVSSIFLYGGIQEIPNSGHHWEPANLTMKIDISPTISTWVSDSLPASLIPGRARLQAVTDRTGQVYIWGGTLNLKGLIDNSMYIYNTINESWKVSQAKQEIESRYDYSATLLSDGRILYIGGFKSRDNLMVDIKQIIIYNTQNEDSPWSKQSTQSSLNISSRAEHTAVLSPDEKKVILYGGHTNFVTPQYPFLVLDIAQMIWTLPELGNLPVQIPRAHTATMFQNYMFIAFGNYNMADQYYNETNDLRILDLSNGNYKFVENYVVPSPISSSSVLSTTRETPPNINENAPLKPQKFNVGLIASIIGGSLFILSLMAVTGYILHYKNKKGGRGKYTSTSTSASIRTRGGGQQQQQQQQQQANLASQIPNRDLATISDRRGSNLVTKIVL